MSEEYYDKFWSAFERSGNIADYLSFRGIQTKSSEGEYSDADNNRGCSNFNQGRR